MRSAAEAKAFHDNLVQGSVEMAKAMNSGATFAAAPGLGAGAQMETNLPGMLSPAAMSSWSTTMISTPRRLRNRALEDATADV